MSDTPDAFTLAKWANNGESKTEFNQRNCRCDVSVGDAPCQYCTIHNALTKAKKLERELAEAKEKLADTCVRLSTTGVALLRTERELAEARQESARLWSAIFLSSKELDARVCEIATLRDVHEAELGVCEKHCPELAEARKEIAKLRKCVEADIVLTRKWAENLRQKADLLRNGVRLDDSCDDLSRIIEDYAARKEAGI